MSIYIDGEKCKDGITENIWPDGARFEQNSDGTLNLLDTDNEACAFWNWCDAGKGKIWGQFDWSPHSDATGFSGQLFLLPDESDKLRHDCVSAFAESRKATVE